MFFQSKLVHSLLCLVPLFPKNNEIINEYTIIFLESIRNQGQDSENLKFRYFYIRWNMYPTKMCIK